MPDPAPAAPKKKGFIRCFGLFWSAEEIDWSPGTGNSGFRMLGRFGSVRPKLQLCDFRAQTGIYVLYDDYGPYYVGLARTSSIGTRLLIHHRDKHAGKWDRFSWFGFRGVSTRRLADGTQKLARMPERLVTPSHWTIADIEALLIQSLGTQHRGNRQEMKFAAAKPWTQLMRHQVDEYVAKVRR
jgi:hypothetical protein